MSVDQRIGAACFGERPSIRVCKPFTATLFNESIYNELIVVDVKRLSLVSVVNGQPSTGAENGAKITEKGNYASGLRRPPNLTASLNLSPSLLPERALHQPSTIHPFYHLDLQKSHCDIARTLENKLLIF